MSPNAAGFVPRLVAAAKTHLVWWWLLTILCLGGGGLSWVSQLPMSALAPIPAEELLTWAAAESGKPGVPPPDVWALGPTLHLDSLVYQLPGILAGDGLDTERPGQVIVPKSLTNEQTQQLRWTLKKLPLESYTSLIIDQNSQLVFPDSIWELVAKRCPIRSVISPDSPQTLTNFTRFPQLQFWRVTRVTGLTPDSWAPVLNQCPQLRVIAADFLFIERIGDLLERLAGSQHLEVLSLPSLTAVRPIDATITDGPPVALGANLQVVREPLSRLDREPRLKSLPKLRHLLLPRPLDDVAEADWLRRELPQVRVHSSPLMIRRVAAIFVNIYLLLFLGLLTADRLTKQFTLPWARTIPGFMAPHLLVTLLIGLGGAVACSVSVALAAGSWWAGFAVGWTAFTIGMLFEGIGRNLGERFAYWFAAATMLGPIALGFAGWISGKGVIWAMQRAEEVTLGGHAWAVQGLFVVVSLALVGHLRRLGLLAVTHQESGAPVLQSKQAFAPLTLTSAGSQVRGPSQSSLNEWLSRWQLWLADGDFERTLQPAGLRSYWSRLFLERLADGWPYRWHATILLGLQGLVLALVGLNAYGRQQHGMYVVSPDQLHAEIAGTTLYVTVALYSLLVVIARDRMRRLEPALLRPITRASWLRQVIGLTFLDLAPLLPAIWFVPSLLATRLDTVWPVGSLLNAILFSTAATILLWSGLLWSTSVRNGWQAFLINATGLAAAVFVFYCHWNLFDPQFPLVRTPPTLTLLVASAIIAGLGALAVRRWQRMEVARLTPRR